MTNTEQKAFIQQYKEIHESLMRFCIVKSRGIMDPKDLAHDVLLVGLENYRKIKDKQALLPYLFTTANRICINKIRRKKFAGAYSEEKAERLVDSQSPADATADVSFLYDALELLPPLQKEALVLFEISDLPIKEIMVIQQAGESTVKQRIKRGRDKLAELLQEKKPKQIAVATSILSSTNIFSMSQLQDYFQAAKELPLPLSHEEAINTINNFQLSGAATNASASKLGTVVAKKTIIGSVVIGGVITTAIILANTSPTSNENNLSTTTAAVAPTESIHQEKLADHHNSPYSKRTYVLTPEDLAIATPNIQETSDSIINSTPLELNEPIATVTNQPKGTVVENVSTEGVQHLIVDNLSGSIEVKLWDNNHIEIIPKHDIKLKDSQKKPDFLAAIKPIIEREKDTITVSSPICTNKKKQLGIPSLSSNSITLKNGKKLKYKSMDLNYVIMLPRTANLNIAGHYNQLTLPDLANNLSLKISDTKLNMGDVKGLANLKITYSRGTMGNFSALNLNVHDSKLTFGDVESLSIKSKYSNLKTGNIHLKNSSFFETDMTINSISGSFESTLKYSDITVESGVIDHADLSLFESNFSHPQINDLNISLKYSTLNCEQISSLTLPKTFESQVIVKKVNQMIAESSKYSQYKIGQVIEEINVLSFEDQLTIANSNTSSMYFEGKYTDYEIKLTRPANYHFELINNYGKVDYEDLNLKINSNESHGTKKVIKGFFENGRESVSPELKFICFESNIKLI